MKTITDALLTIVVMGAILIVSAIFTNLFTRAMYYRCGECGTLNAKRRARCRNCGGELEAGG